MSDSPTRLLRVLLVSATPVLLGHGACPPHPHPHAPSTGECTGGTVSCNAVYLSNSQGGTSLPTCPPGCQEELETTEDGFTRRTCRGEIQCSSVTASGRCQSAGRAWVECDADSDCPSDEKCIRYTCGACNDHSDCGEGQRCREKDLICVTANGANGEACERDGQCINACISGTCADRRAPGQRCWNNADCISRLCQGEVCGCIEDAQCNAGQRCKSDRTCVTTQGVDGTPCTADGQCLNACYQGICRARGDYGDGCDTPADCRPHSTNCPGRCDVGFGTTGTGRCIPTEGCGTEGDYCTHRHHCTSGNCDQPNASSSDPQISVQGTCE